jgi:hypothetical protein
MTTPHKWAAEIHAIADGKEVEGLYEIFGNTRWYLATNDCNPLTNPLHQWRIKPEKKVLRYRVAVLEKDGQKFTQTADSNEDAIELATCPYFVEWRTDWQEVEVE